MEIKFDKVCYGVKGKNILNDLSFEAKSTKITALIGPTGSGKSSVFDLLTLKRIPKDGKISIEDYEITRKGILSSVLAYHSKIAYIPSHPEDTFSYDSILKEFFSVLEKYNYNLVKRRQHIEDALGIVGLHSSYLYKDPFSLSSGELRLISLAIALSYNPKVLLWDEPTIGLDREGKKALISLLTRLKSRYQKTILIASHDIDFVNQIADEIVVLKEGKVLLSGKKKDVFSESEKLLKEGIDLPKMVQFQKEVWERKKVKLGYQCDKNDLVKEILRKS